MGLGIFICLDFVHVYTCMCDVHVYICVCVVPLCVHVWKPEVNVICLPLYSLIQSGTYPFQLRQLAGSSQDLSVSIPKC